MAIHKQIEGETLMNKKYTLGALGAAMLLSSTLAVAEGNRYTPTYKVEITNITSNVQFTPVLAVTHRPVLQLFELGEPASPELSLLAEGGATGPLQTLLDAFPAQVGDTETTEGLLGPGETVSFRIKASHRYRSLSLAAMLLPTNDTFVALNNVPLPRRYRSTYFAEAYDAGSEPNDEICANIPGPQCGGEGPSPDFGGEGFVHISPGIHGEADLAASAYDWRSSVAKVVITRVR